MDYLEIQKPLRDNYTVAELATFLPKVTKHPINNRKAEKWLRDSGLAWQKSTKDGWNGPIPAVINDPGTYGQAICDAVDLFLAYLVDPDETIIHSHLKEYGEKTHDTIMGLRVANVVTDTQVEAFFALGGGQPFKHETPTTIQAAKDAYDADTAWENKIESMYGGISEAINVANQDPAIVAQALRDQADILEA